MWIVIAFLAVVVDTLLVAGEILIGRLEKYGSED